MLGNDLGQHHCQEVSGHGVAAGIGGSGRQPDTGADVGIGQRWPWSGIEILGAIVDQSGILIDLPEELGGKGQILLGEPGAEHFRHVKNVVFLDHFGPGDIG